MRHEPRCASNPDNASSKAERRTNVAAQRRTRPRQSTPRYSVFRHMLTAADADIKLREHYCLCTFLPHCVDEHLGRYRAATSHSYCSSNVALTPPSPPWASSFSLFFSARRRLFSNLLRGYREKSTDQIARHITKRVSAQTETNGKCTYRPHICRCTTVENKTQVNGLLAINHYVETPLEINSHLGDKKLSNRVGSFFQ